VLLTVTTEGVPIVPREDRIEVEPLGKRFWRVTLRYGFMQIPNVPKALALGAAEGLEFDMMSTSFFLGHVALTPGRGSALPRWRRLLFGALARNGFGATEFFRLPPNRASSRWVRSSRSGVGRTAGATCRKILCPARRPAL
jgi:KUP system potassium uptake protein